MAVVITPGLVLDPVYPLTHARIGYQSYLFELGPADVTASTEADRFPADAPLRPDTYERWQPTSSPATWEVDLGVAQAVDYAGIAAHTIGSVGAAVTVQYSTDGTSWTDLADERIPQDDAPILILADTVEARYWRLSITGGAPEVGVVYLGEVLPMERPIYGGQTPVTMARRTTVRPSKSEAGEMLGQTEIRRGIEGSAGPWQHLSPTWVRANFEPFAKAARTRPFFYAWRPATYPQEVGYVRSKGDIVPENEGQREWMSVSFDYEGIGHAD